MIARVAEIPAYSAETLLALALYALVTSITPGPNNLMLLSSGINYGFRRSIPHMLGISIGFGVMVLAVGLGLTRLFLAYPATYAALRIVGAGYLAWLAWRIATSGAPGSGAPSRRPMTFLAAAAFQWVNPKAWVMAVGAIANYAPVEATVGAVVIVAGVYVLVGGPSVAVWAAFGSTLRTWLADARRLRAFNLAMAALLLLSLCPLLTAELG
ncbi:LysE family translocator [Leucobacter sp. wl10]|uniref:LysE family translocator n=1 Tax=Leucobacter sp. wl10 TaxID=2304677 RepID=UPI000E5AC0FD|nr:LysE family translocator [Leucobacter sp. wl10]RGE20380.1 LysE family translocator [Leucobacter sp. wl10]